MRLRRALLLLGFVTVLLLLYLAERYLRPDQEEDVGFGGLVLPISQFSARVSETAPDAVPISNGVALPQANPASGSGEAR